MCFAPQQRALFRHRNFQKWSETVSFLHFLTWKCASSHNEVHFFDIWTSKSGPNLVCFVHLIWKRASTTTACNFSSLIWPAGSAPAALASLLFLPFRAPALFLFPDLLKSSHFCSSPPWLFPPLLFHLSIMSEVWLLNFLRSAMPCRLCKRWGSHSLSCKAEICPVISLATQRPRNLLNLIYHQRRCDPQTWSPLKYLDVCRKKVRRHAEDGTIKMNVKVECWNEAILSNAACVVLALRMGFLGAWAQGQSWAILVNPGHLEAKALHGQKFQGELGMFH